MIRVLIAVTWLAATPAEARWYDSETGTWLSRDDIGAASYLQLPNELNPWQYAAGNPTRFVDADGRGAFAAMGCFVLDSQSCSQAHRFEDAFNQGLADTAVGMLNGVNSLGGIQSQAWFGGASGRLVADGPLSYRYRLDNVDDQARSRGAVESFVEGVRDLPITTGKNMVIGTVVVVGKPIDDAVRRCTTNSLMWPEMCGGVRG